ncbi:MAG: DUF368 domain-containing protein [Phycisphaerales bacterium]|nr:DUF368 domain-containing protein [Phycisphaerales bacterium]
MAEQPLNATPSGPDAAPEPALLPLAARSVAGGTLMGLANLVPGISGGTMLLVTGIYPRFIGAIAEVTTLRFRLRSLVVLGMVAAAAGLAIVLGAGPVKDLVVHHRWAAYSVFIGLTLGGVPVIWTMAKGLSLPLAVGALGGLGAMIALAMLSPAGGSSGGGGFLGLFVAGLAGASAMILPGVSGGYLLLVLGQYVPILSAIDAARDAVASGDYSAAMDPVVRVFIPVGLGVGIGIAAVSNLIRYLLRRFEKPTLGVLLGLVLGAVVGLWPFQEGVEPTPGDVIKGVVQTPETIAALDEADWPTRRFTPNAVQVGSSLGLAGLGFVLTLAIAHIGRDRRS